ncbi:MAG: PD40 domain-containing protein [Bacteroidales bacterium]|nr:PD40 domain-containing protein [Bacteroidales bacterium]
MVKLKTLIILAFSVFSLNGHSQNFHTSSNRAMRFYNDGLAAYDFLDFKHAEANFREAISQDKNFYEAYIMLGDLMAKQKKYGEAIVNYRKAVKIDSLFFKPVFFTLAEAEMKSGDYANALIHYKVYLAQAGMSAKNTLVAAKSLKDCEFAVKAVKNPIPFNPVNVGSGINTKEDEYWPSISADGSKLVFTRQDNPGDYPSNSVFLQEDFYISIYSDTIWNKSFNAGPPLNTLQNEGAQSLSSDGNYMYFTSCDRRGGMGSCDIYFSSNNDGKWTEPANLRSPVNTPGWESQPSISADGGTLFFASSRQGGIGGKDLWYSRLNEKNEWTEPVNLGDGINTAGDEMSPFIHFDGRTLYFASDGRPGMGGFDVYLTRMNDDSTWTEPQNLGYPINTFSDEMGLVIESNGKKAYFSSTRNKSQGKDIFSFNLYESARPNPVSYLKGKVYDKETGKMLKADYELINLSTNQKIIKNSTDGMGSFLVCLPSGYNYGINIIKRGYLFYSENFMFEGEHSVAEPFIKKIVLSPLKAGEKMQLANVFYEVDSWQLKKESLSELDNLVNLISENKNIVIEIGGFTDSTGTNEYNLTLSEKRALSVVDYLISKGIPSASLKYKGYGNSMPLGDNVTSEGRKLNRRTEARILEVKK